VKQQLSKTGEILLWVSELSYQKFALIINNLPATDIGLEHVAYSLGQENMYIHIDCGCGVLRVAKIFGSVVRTVYSFPRFNFPGAAI